MTSSEHDYAYLWDMLRAAQDAHEILTAKGAAVVVNDKINRLAIESRLGMIV